MPVPTLRPLGFGEILDGAFSLYRRNFVPFILTAFIPSLALLVGGLIYAFSMASAVGEGGNAAAAAAGVMGVFLLFIILVLGATLVSWGALTRQAAQAFTGAPVSVGDGLRAGLRAFFPMLGAALLMGIVVLVILFAVGIVGGILAAVVGAIGVVVLFVAMAAVYMVSLAVFAGVAPSVVVEHRGPLGALTRSFDLMKGAVLRVVGLVVVSFLIAYLPVIAVMFVTGTSSMMLNPATAQMPSAGALIAQQVLGWIAGVLTTPFMVSVFVLTYFDRRVRTEALDVQMMAEGLPTPAAAGY